MDRYIIQRDELAMRNNENQPITIQELKNTLIKLRKW
jgi:hypothetical protein